MTDHLSSQLPFARQGDACVCLGRSRRSGPCFAKRRGEIWVVLHRQGAEWTHVYRLDEKDGRTAYLENFAPGDARAALISWAIKAFDIEVAEPLVRAA